MFDETNDASSSSMSKGLLLGQIHKNTGNNTYGYLVSKDTITINIDAPDDLKFAKNEFQKREG